MQLKRRTLIELQGDILAEENLIVAAQHRLSAAEQARLQGHRVRTVTPQSKEKRELTILGTAQTPAKD